ncbi:MAG: hypothetical protein ABJ370_12145 [Paracoccaceae bacterium]
MSDITTYFNSLEALQVIGIVGFLLYLASFSGVQLEVLDGNGITYAVLNVFAASFVGLSLLAEFNLASALIQASWVIIGLAGISRRVYRRTRSSAFPFQLNLRDAK